MRIDADVVIVGAGPAGSTAAIVLARRGVNVVLVDRANFPRQKPCGDYCDPGAVRLLSELGCLPAAVGAGGAAISAMRVVAQDGTEFTAPFPYGHGLLCPRVHLDAVLVETAARAGAEVLEGFQVDDAAIHDEWIEIRTGGRPPIAGRLLIVADGMRSPTARRLGLYSEPRSGRFTVGAYFAVSGPGPRGELHLGPGFYCGVARFDRRTANVCMALPSERLKGHPPEQAFANTLTSFPALADELAGAQRISPFRCSGPVGFRASRAAVDRVLLAGDAAMQIDPMSGQGIFLALRSGMLAAAVAAGALASSNLSARSLHSYVLRRAGEFGRKVTAARILQSLALRPDLTSRLVRRLRSRPDLASQLLGVTGDTLAPKHLLDPRYLWGLLAHASSA